MEILTRQPALALYQTLSGEIDALIEIIRAHCAGVVVYRLPVVEADSEVPTAIAVDKLGSLESVDAAVLSLATEAYRHFGREHDQKRSTTYRLPGAIRVQIDLSEPVNRINQLKAQLQALLRASYPGTVARSRACQQLFPGVHMNQLYRHLYVVPPDCARVNLTWQCQTPADVWISPADAISMATTALEDEATKRATEHNEDRLTALRIALAHFQSLPAPLELTEKDLADAQPPPIPYQLLHRTYVRPHPRAQFFDAHPGSRAMATHPANLPLICTEGANQALSIRSLRPYNAGQSQRRSDAKTGFEEISSALHIHGGVPSLSMVQRRLALLRQARQRRVADG